MKHNLLFFRIGSNFIPFASHPICTYNWEKHFKKDFLYLGTLIKKEKMRISMHPDQFVLINAKDKNIVEKSIEDLKYHCQLLDTMKLDNSAKVQIHIGGIYNNKEASKKRFIKEYEKLSYKIKKRLVIENDHNRFSLQDCIDIYNKTNIPVVLDTFHHECLNNGEHLEKAIKMAQKTWKPADGPPILHYSSQHKNKRKGAHADKIDLKHFKKFIILIKKGNFDVMLEIKDKEKSALKAAKSLFS